jgi:hypothetical protein
MQRSRGRRRAALAITGSVAVAVGILLFLLLRNSGPQEVAPQALPVPRGAARTATYINCSPQTDVSYIANLPCDTSILIRPDARVTAASAIREEQRVLATNGWRHARGGWISSDATVCATVVPLRAEHAAIAANIRGRGTMTTAKARFLRAAHRAEATDTTIYAMLYPASFQGQRRC